MTAAAADLAAASLAPATRRAYRAALERLDSWRAGHNRPLNAFDEPSGTSETPEMARARCTGFLGALMGIGETSRVCLRY